jgi:hypothetical protein
VPRSSVNGENINTRGGKLTDKAFKFKQCCISIAHRLRSAPAQPSGSASTQTKLPHSYVEGRQRQVGGTRVRTDDVRADGDGDNGLGGAECCGVLLHRAGRSAAAAAGVAEVEVLHRGPLHGARGSGVLRRQVCRVGSILSSFARVVPPPF